MSEPAADKVQIGWREWVDLPDWGLRLKAKIDTGARSSSLDVENIERLDDRRIRFDVHQLRKTDLVKTVEAEILRESKVRSSNGQTQKRFVVKTRIRLAGIEKDIHITLSSRRKMLHRMLLGREALKDYFLIDAGADHLVSPVKKKKRRELVG
jgi:hypothetical protein